jgi:replicative DNA helicase
MVWIIHRQPGESATTFILEKQRQGSRGEIPLEFDSVRCIFTEPAPVEW